MSWMAFKEGAADAVRGFVGGVRQGAGMDRSPLDKIIDELPDRSPWGRFQGWVVFTALAGIGVILLPIVLVLLWMAGASLLG